MEKEYFIFACACVYVCVSLFLEARTKIRIMYYLSELERCKFLVNEIYIAFVRNVQK